MPRRIIHIVFTSCLAFILLFGGTAKEFVHSFADHEDTMHCMGDHEGLAFENEHHHCDFLSFSLPDFLTQTVFIPNTIDVPFYQEYDSALVAAVFDSPRLLPSFRGPPRNQML